jgi:hypothetical protein
MFSACVLRNKQGMPVYDRGRTNCTVTFYCEFYVLDFTSFQGDSVTNALRRNKKKKLKLNHLFMVLILIQLHSVWRTISATTNAACRHTA